jgi:predicted PurR-regulated permease PerM
MGVELSYDRRQISAVFLGILFILVFLLLIYLIKPILGALALTVVLTYIIHPLMESILPKIKRRFLAVMIAFVFILVPFFVFTVVLISAVVVQLIELVQVPGIKELADLTGATVKDVLPSPEEIFTLETILNQELFGTIINFLTAVGGMFLQVFLAIFFTAYVLYKEDKILGFVQSTKNHKLGDFILFVDQGLKQVVFSMFLTAFITGLIATGIYVVFGTPFPILLGALTGVVALIPILGVWLVYLPLTILFINQGQTFLALLFLGVSILFISTIPDIVIRPIIVGKKEHIDLGLLIVGFVTGTLAFGPIGIILGPLVIISLVAFVRIFFFDEEIVNH